MTISLFRSVCRMASWDNANYRFFHNIVLAPLWNIFYMGFEEFFPSTMEKKLGIGIFNRIVIDIGAVNKF